MQAALRLDQMTIEEELPAVETIWDDLCRNEKQIPVTDWQKELLDERHRLVASGEAVYDSWEAAKVRIRERTP